MTAMVRRMALLGAALPLALASALITAPAATADGGHVVVDAPSPLLSLSRLAPGVSGSSTMTITNDSSGPAALHLQATDLHDDDNGCNRPERVVDASCGDGEGELAEQLQMTVETPTGVAPAISWTGTVLELADGVWLARDVPAGARVPLDVTVVLPFASGNETQTDRVSFDLRVTLSGATGDSSVAVGGTKIGRDEPGDGPSVAGVMLAATGAAALPALFAVGALAVATGVVLVARGRRLPR